MRAVLVFNPNATTTDAAVRDTISTALAEVVDLDVQPTKQRGHATHIVAGAIDEGVDTVFALGGDGTVNEVIQAMAGTPTVLGPIPGGGTNVFARALGLPNHPVAATQRLLEDVRADRRRLVSLGRANGRYFAFNAGLGFDAAVVKEVEQSPLMKARLRQAAFVWSATRTFLAGARRDPASITLQAEDGTTLSPAGMAIVGNTDPWTYLQSWPLHITPEASLETGLDVTMLGAMSPTRLVRLVGQALRHRLSPQHDVSILHDLDGFSLISPVALPLQVDGDYAGEHARVDFEAMRDALAVWGTA